MKKVLVLGGLLVVAAVIFIGVFFSSPIRSMGRNAMLGKWFLNHDSAWMMKANSRCADAPFAFPTNGYVGFIWDDSFRPGHRHQGIDVFGGQPSGEEPVYAAYDGYLTRLPDWISTVIIRVPDDPLQPGRQIWTYYTHMASSSGDSFIAADFPPGTYEMPVKAGDLLGYQGNYSGTPGNPTGIHLHFSIIRSDDDGKFLNELAIANTVDPSPYFGLRLNAESNKNSVPLCGMDE